MTRWEGRVGTEEVENIGLGYLGIMLLKERASTSMYVKAHFLRCSRGGSSCMKLPAQLSLGVVVRNACLDAHTHVHATFPIGIWATSYVSQKQIAFTDGKNGAAFVSAISRPPASRWAPCWPPCSSHCRSSPGRSRAHGRRCRARSSPSGGRGPPPVRPPSPGTCKSIGFETSYQT